MNRQDVINFFSNEYVDQASYDNLRKISSAVDGLKNSNRKVIYTVLAKNIKDLIKVQQLASKVAEFTDYLHGSLDGVVSNLGQDFMGSNQIPLLKKKGNFGTRSIPTPSAPRYIFAKKSDLLDSLFIKMDDEILMHQTFEGQPIEPRFLVPTLPIIFINGSRGVSSGFSQLIGQRDIKDILTILTKKLEGKSDFKEFDKIPMFFNGYKGTVTRFPDDTCFKWAVEGVYKVEKDTVTISELPPDTRLIPYIQYLNDLVDEKVIKKFSDECSGDDWVFKITLNKGHKMTDEQIIKLFKLRTTITENFTCMGADNKIKEFKSPSQILEYFYDIKMQYMDKRKTHMLQNIKKDKSKKENQYRFLSEVISGGLNIQKMKTADLDLYLKQNKYDMFDNSYRYLTGMPMSSMQLDVMEKLKDEIKKLSLEYETLEHESLESIWLKDITVFKKALKEKK